ncbi:hypothetical protein [Methylovorus glucosotrophus]|nr:hypothetical protein [Methylovorus glucosotrophus]
MAWLEHGLKAHTSEGGFKKKEMLRSELVAAIPVHVSTSLLVKASQAED